LGAFTVLPDSVLAASPPASSLSPPPESLQQSIQRLRAFPFRPDGNGNTQEIVVCLWRQRNQADLRLRELTDAGTLEPWRTSRRRACEQVTARAEGGTLLPILWFTCDNALNRTLLKQLTTPSP
jgi:hypothetical protein